MIRESIILLLVLLFLYYLFNKKVRKLTRRRTAPSATSDHTTDLHTTGIHGSTRRQHEKRKLLEEKARLEKRIAPLETGGRQRINESLEKLNKSNPRTIAGMVTYWVNEKS